MLITPLDERLRQKGGPHLARWLASVERARELEAEGHLFHGTTSQAGRAILEEGFRPRHEGFAFHVYWGPLSYALSFADRGWNDPALLAAPLESILASGTPLPMTSEDRQMEEEPELSTWRESIAESGCMRIHEGRRVEGLILLSHL